MILSRSRHEKDGTHTGHLLRSSHHYGDVGFVHVYAGTNIAPTPSRTQLVRPSTHVNKVELGSGEALKGSMDQYDSGSLGSADPCRPEPFMVASSDPSAFRSFGPATLPEVAANRSYGQGRRVGGGEIQILNSPPKPRWLLLRPPGDAPERPVVVPTLAASATVAPSRSNAKPGDGEEDDVSLGWANKVPTPNDATDSTPPHQVPRDGRAAWDGYTLAHSASVEQYRGGAGLRGGDVGNAMPNGWTDKVARPNGTAHPDSPCRFPRNGHVASGAFTLAVPATVNNHPGETRLRVGIPGVTLIDGEGNDAPSGWANKVPSPNGVTESTPSHQAPRDSSAALASATLAHSASVEQHRSGVASRGGDVGNATPYGWTDKVPRPSGMANSNSPHRNAHNEHVEPDEFTHAAPATVNNNLGETCLRVGAPGVTLVGTDGKSTPPGNYTIRSWPLTTKTTTGHPALFTSTLTARPVVTPTPSGGDRGLGCEDGAPQFWAGALDGHDGMDYPPKAKPTLTTYQPNTNSTAGLTQFGRYAATLLDHAGTHRCSDPTAAKRASVALRHRMDVVQEAAARHAAQRRASYQIYREELANQATRCEIATRHSHDSTADREPDLATATEQLLSSLARAVSNIDKIRKEFAEDHLRIVEKATRAVDSLKGDADPDPYLAELVAKHREDTASTCHPNALWTADDQKRGRSVHYGDTLYHQARKRHARETPLAMRGPHRPQSGGAGNHTTFDPGPKVPTAHGHLRLRGGGTDGDDVDDSGCTHDPEAMEIYAELNKITGGESESSSDLNGGPTTQANHASAQTWMTSVCSALTGTALSAKRRPPTRATAKAAPQHQRRSQ